MTVLAALIAMAMVGCQNRPELTITSVPERATIDVEGEIIGETPLTHQFDFNKQQTYRISAEKDGFYSAERVLRLQDPALVEGTLELELHEDPVWQATASSDATNQWVRLQLQPEWSDAWQRLIDSVTTRYTSIEQMDYASGYLRSMHLRQSFDHPEHGQVAIRTQFVGTLASTDPYVYKYKIVSQRKIGADGTWDNYRRVFKGDAQLIEELNGRLSVK